MATLILTAIGDDRPGLVETLADAIRGAGGTWDRSSMSRLGSKFAGIVEVAVPDDHEHDLIAAVGAIGDDVLQVTVERTDAGTGATGTAVSLELVGQDRPGIVHEISEVLARFGVSIDQLDTTTSSAPMSAEALFEARAVLRVPAAVDQADLADALESIAQELMVDVELDTAVNGEPGSVS